MKGVGHWSFHRAVSNSYFEKVLPVIILILILILISIVILKLRAICLTISFLLIFFLIENYELGALRKELIIAPLIERFKTVTLRNSY